MKNNIVGIDVSKEYILYIDKVLERGKSEILSFFETPNLDFKVTTYIYKDIESLKEGLAKRGIGPYPSYMVACMVDEDQSKLIKRSINFYEPPTKTDDNSYTKKEYNNVIYHELIHYITDILFGKLPEWLTEGIAKYLDGSYNQDITNLINDIIPTYEIPDISTMQGDNFVITTTEERYTEEGFTYNTKYIYNGYDYSYLMVRYIIEEYGKEALFNLMKNQEEIKKIEQNILIEAIDYFNSLYLKENTIKK